MSWRLIQGLLFPHPPVADKGSGTLPVTLKGLKIEHFYFILMKTLCPLQAAVETWQHLWTQGVANQYL